MTAVGDRVLIDGPDFQYEAKVVAVRSPDDFDTVPLEGPNIGDIGRVRVTVYPHP